MAPWLRQHRGLYARLEQSVPKSSTFARVRNNLVWESLTP